MWTGGLLSPWPSGRRRPRELRVARAGDAIRVSFENLKPGSLREGHFSMPCEVVRILVSTLLLAAAAGGDSMNVVFTIEEGTVSKG